MSLLNPENWSESDVEFGKRRWEYWSTMFTVRKEFVAALPADVSVLDIPAKFEEFMFNEHGIEMGKDQVGNYTADFKIVDEHKFLLFKLKYS